MGFKLPIDAKEYFRLIDELDNKEGNKFNTDFDKYYLCLMAGFDRRKIAQVEQIGKEVFVNDFPGAYKNTKELIIGLLIDTEMSRKRLEADDRAHVEQLIVNIVDPDSSTKLQPSGMQLMNQYAAYGMGVIKESIPRPNSLESFLIQYHRLLNPSV